MVPINAAYDTLQLVYKCGRFVNCKKAVGVSMFFVILNTRLELNISHTSTILKHFYVDKAAPRVFYVVVNYKHCCSKLLITALWIQT